MEKKPRVLIADDPGRLTKAAKRVIDAAVGRMICCQHTEGERFQDGVSYWIEPGGKRADPDAVKELLRKRRLIPIQDGLFEGDTQTYRVAQ